MPARLMPSPLPPPLWLSLLVASLGAACGASAPSVPTTPEGLAIAFDDAYCESMVECLQMPDLETCRAVSFAERDRRTRTLTAAVAAGTVVVDVDAAAKCLAFVRGYGCSQAGASADTAAGEACADMYRGQVAAAGSCALHEECGEDLFCKYAEACTPSTACCQGACAAPPPAPALPAIGADCTDVGACVDGAWCHYDFETSVAMCEARGGAGDACVDWDACALDLICDLDLQTSMGTCKRPAAEGEACSPNGLGVCDRFDDYCDATTKTCTALKDAGAACVGADECRGWTTCSAGTCQARPLEGQACSDEHRCLGELRCEGGTCAPPADEAACPL